MKNRTIEHRFKDYILKENLFTTKNTLLVAVSGGVDSVVLCHLCHTCGLDFHIAHCNFKLRGADSDADAEFVEKLAARYHVPFYQKAFNTTAFAEENKMSIQVAARDLRYTWFKQLMESKDSKPFHFLLTAHHADDNVETILMNFFKGTGINGLRGILPRNGKIVRPLLFLQKAELVQYAVQHDLDHREDSSNASDKYTRNFFRNTLIPSVEKVFPAVTENLADNADRFREIHILYKEAVAGHLKKLAFKNGKELHMPVLKWQHSPAVNTLMFEIIKDYGFSAAQTNDVIKLLHGDTGKYVNSSSHRIYRYNKWLILSELQNDEAETLLVEADTRELATKDFVLRFHSQSMPVAVEPGKDVAMLDMKDISFPLILRKWKRGDYFYPLGMRKKKKLGRFLSDEKLSLDEKEKTWVVESDRKIIWVVGKRIDDRFKITDQTKNLLKINRFPSK